MEIEKRTANISTLLTTVVFMAAFMPCVISALFDVFINSSVRMLAYWVLVIGMSILLAQQNHMLYLSRRGLYWFVTWMAVWGVSILRNGDISRGIYAGRIQMLVIIAFTTVIVASRKHLYRYIFKAIEILEIIQLIAGFYFLANPEALSRLGTEFFRADGLWLTKFNQFVASGCFMGISTHYSTSGMFLSIAVILFASECLEEKVATGTFRVIKVLLLIAATVALILTQKRAHLLFVAFSCVLMYFVGCVRGNMGKKLKQTLVAIIVIALVIVLIFNIPAFSGTIARFLTGDTIDEISSGRVSTLWEPAWKLFVKNVGLGIGWQNFKWIHIQYQANYGTVNNNVHNIYLQLLCETGILIGTLIIAFLISIYVLTWKYLLRYKKFRCKSAGYLPMLFSFGYQTFFLMYGLTGNPLYDIQCLFPYILCSGLTFKYAFAKSNMTISEEVKVREPRKRTI